MISQGLKVGIWWIARQRSQAGLNRNWDNTSKIKLLINKLKYLGIWNIGRYCRFQFSEELDTKCQWCLFKAQLIDIWQVVFCWRLLARTWWHVLPSSLEAHIHQVATGQLASSSSQLGFNQVSAPSEKFTGTFSWSIHIYVPWHPITSHMIRFG